MKINMTVVTEHELTAFLDIGSEINLIGRSLVQQLDLTSINIDKSIMVQTINGKQIKMYKVFFLEVSVKDSKGRMQYFNESFLAADLPVMEFVLGMPWFELANSDIDWK